MQEKNVKMQFAINKKSDFVSKSSRISAKVYATIVYNQICVCNWILSGLV